MILACRTCLEIKFSGEIQDKPYCDGCGSHTFVEAAPNTWFWIFHPFIYLRKRKYEKETIDGSNG